MRHQQSLVPAELAGQGGCCCGLLDGSGQKQIELLLHPAVAIAKW